jgi:cytoskeletal protein RodZ
MTDPSELEARLRRLEQRVDANSSRLDAVDRKAGEFRQHQKHKLRTALVALFFWIAVVLFIGIPFVWYAFT